MRRALPWIAMMCAVLAGTGVARAATQVQAQLAAGTIEAGGSVALTVSVLDANGNVGEPRFRLPPGLELLGSERGQSFSWVNGKSTSEVQFRYEIGTQSPGRFSIGPIRVPVGRQVYLYNALSLNVTKAAVRSTSSYRGPAPASLVIQLSPPHPYVGQLAQLSMKLLQPAGQDLSTNGNSTPTTPGFWSENWGDPIQYRGRQGDRVVAVSEQRVRVYPLAPGVATIGNASLLVIPGSFSGLDPYSTGAPARPIEINSDSLRVAVQPLPPGAPPGFANAVGDLAFAWGLDRGHSAQDQALTLHLDVRGVGNLPLLRTPALSLPDFEVFATTVNDSFAPAGEIQPGRRRFLWTLMPKHSGTVRLEPPAIAWFDPATARYHAASLPALEVEVLPTGSAAAAGAEPGGFPRELMRDPAAPGARLARPWAFLLAGALFGIAWRYARRPRVVDPLESERVRGRKLFQVIGEARGADFWRAADEAVQWVEERGVQVLRLREDIAAARYGGVTSREDEVRRRMLERLAETMPDTPGSPPRLAVGAVLALLAVAFVALGLPGSADEQLRARAVASEGQARGGNDAAAAAEWTRLWQEAPGDAALAARLAWAALHAGHVADAAVWTLRGGMGEPRDAALSWIADRVREAGGLTGAKGQLLPLRSLEWGVLAFALALAAACVWPRRVTAAGLATLALAAAMAAPVQREMLRGRSLAVIRTPTALAGADLGLDPGQVVRVLKTNGDLAHVTVGRGLEGDVPARALIPVVPRGR